MPKAKINGCYQSPDGAKPPRCCMAGSVMCPACVNALGIYKGVKACRAARRRQANRASADRSRQRKDQKSSDVYSDNLALTAEFEEMEQELADLAKARQALVVAITGKAEERDGLANAHNLGLVTPPAPPSK